MTPRSLPDPATGLAGMAVLAIATLAACFAAGAAVARLIYDRLQGRHHVEP